MRRPHPTSRNPERRGLAPENAQHLAAKDAIQLRHRNFRTGSYRGHYLFWLSGVALGGDGPVMRWGLSSRRPILFLAARQTELKKCLRAERR
jgi:hypothetical protein